jgi:hypothetical protein
LSRFRHSSVSVLIFSSSFAFNYTKIWKSEI